MTINEKVAAREIGSNKVWKHLRKLEQLLFTVRVNWKVFERGTRWQV
jgi:hypothetical protein